MTRAPDTRAPHAARGPRPGLRVARRAAGPDRPLRAFVWMLGAVASFTLMAVAGREIQVEMNTFELMLYRSVIGFAVVASLVGLAPRGFAQVRTPVPGLHVRRNLWHYAGQNLWFYAVAAIPLSQLVALEFTNPLWVALVAPLMLGERLTRLRVVALALGFAGVIIVARPGVSPLEAGHAAGLAAALGFALNTIYTKQIMRHDGVLCVLFWMTLSQAAMSLVLSLPGGIPLPSATVAPWLVVVGVTGLTAHYALTSALSHAPASTVAPMEFLRLPVITVVGVLLYAEPLSAAILLGATVIIAANLVNLRAGSGRGTP
jgi:drug/metabolite transporter (DMT)-like permease